jgi:hypothetical protein
LAIWNCWNVIGSNYPNSLVELKVLAESGKQAKQLAVLTTIVKYVFQS